MRRKRFLHQIEGEFGAKRTQKRLYFDLVSLCRRRSTTEERWGIFVSSIMSQSDTRCPDSLYKYYSNLQYALANIKDGEVYFARVTLFNDPFECYSEFICIPDRDHFGLSSFRRLPGKLAANDGDKIKLSLEDKIRETREFDIYNIIMGYLKINPEFMEKRASDFAYADSKVDLYFFLQSERKSLKEGLRIGKKG